MEVTAKLKHLRMAPRKVRLVVDTVRGLGVVEAERRLSFLNKKAALPVLKLLKSAIANAENNAKLIKENLYISKITVDGGPTLKRWRARARGNANEILKRTSHINLVLSELRPGLVKKESKKTDTKKGNIGQTAIVSDTDNKSKDDFEKNKAYQRADGRLDDKGLSRRGGADGRKKIFRRKSI